MALPSRHAGRNTQEGGQPALHPAWHQSGDRIKKSGRPGQQQELPVPLHGTQLVSLDFDLEAGRAEPLAVHIFGEASLIRDLARLTRPEKQPAPARRSPDDAPRHAAPPEAAPDRRGEDGDDHVNLKLDEFLGQGGEAIMAAVGEPVGDLDRAALLVTEFAEALPKP